jgi:peptidoglycan/LPS O-acetylase OafA/YrhL
MPFNGYFAVWVFFLVSGFSLSATFIRTRDSRVLATQFAKRYFRLCLPILFYSLLVFSLFQLRLIPGVNERPGRYQEFLTNSPTLWQTTRFALFDVFFHYSEASTLIPPLWTMSYELIGSILVLGSLALAKEFGRRFIVYISIGCLAYFGSPFYCAFVIGIVVAEIYISDDIPGARRALSIISPFFVISSAILATQLPNAGSGHYLSVATLLFLGCVFSNFMRGLLEAGASKFLGRISFSLYLVHSPVLFVVGLRLSRFVDSFNVRAVGLLSAGTAVVITAVIVARALVFVDEASIAFSRRLGRSIIRS